MDSVFFILSHPVRRHLIVTLARNGPEPAVDLNAGLGRNLDATLKQLNLLREAGWVIKTENPGDGRRSLYGLSPKVPVTVTPSAVILEFGFSTVRL